MDVDFGDATNSGGGGGGGDDITSDLLQKFSCMNTNDRDVLINQFKVLLGEKCTMSNAEFWLDMNNWNLQAAVCSYFDFESQNSGFPYTLKLPSMSFLADDNFTDRMPPNTPFVYQCVIHNSGDESWPLGCSLRFIGGTQMTSEERVLLPVLESGQSAQVRLSMVSPDGAGGHQCQWRPATLTGQFFGETIFVIINVIDDLQSVTQQLSDAHLMDAEGNSLASGLTQRQMPMTLPCSTVVPFPSPSGGGAGVGNHLNAQVDWDNLVSSSLPHPSSPNNGTIGCIYPLPPWTTGTCIRGSTAAGRFLGAPPGATFPNIIASENGTLWPATTTNPPLSQAQVSQSVIAVSGPQSPPLMLTHLNPSGAGGNHHQLNQLSPAAPPPSSAASPESLDDSSMS